MRAQDHLRAVRVLRRATSSVFPPATYTGPLGSCARPSRATSRGSVAAGVSAGVVDQKPDLQAGGYRSDVADGARIDEIRCDSVNFDTELTTVRCGRPERTRLARHQNEIQPGFGELPRELRTDAFGSAGDQRPRTVG